MPMRPAMNINQISGGVRGQKVTASMTINLIIFADQFNLCACSVAAGEQRKNIMGTKNTSKMDLRK